MPERRQARDWTRTRKESGHNLAIGGLTLLILALIGGGAVLWRLGETSRIDVDDTTLCRRDKPPASVDIVLLDTSDALSSRNG